MNIRFLLPIVIFLVIAFISAIAMMSMLNGDQKIKPLPSPLIGKNAPGLILVPFHEAPLTSQQKSDLKQFVEDGPFLVNFFASWCAPCQKEAPFLEKLSNEIPIIGVAYKDKPEQLEIFFERFGNPFIKIGFDNDGKASINWGVYGVPETFLISDEGKIILRHAGEITNEVFSSSFVPKIEEMIRK